LDHYRREPSGRKEGKKGGEGRVAALYFNVGGKGKKKKGHSPLAPGRKVKKRVVGKKERGNSLPQPWPGRKEKGGGCTSFPTPRVRGKEEGGGKRRRKKKKKKKSWDLL